MSTSDSATNGNGLVPPSAREIADELVAVARVLLGSARSVHDIGQVPAPPDPGLAEPFVPAVLELPSENDELVVEVTDLSLQTHSTPVPIPLPSPVPAAPIEAPPGPPEPVAIPVPGLGGQARSAELLEEIGFLDD